MNVAYEYENDVVSELTSLAIEYNSNAHYEMADELKEVYAKAKAFDDIRRIENLCYYVEYDKHSDIDREGFKTHSFTRNTLKTIRNWEDKHNAKN